MSGREMMAQPSEFEGIGDDGAEVDLLPIALVSEMARFAGFQDLFDGAEQSFGIFEHDAIELAALRFVDRASLQRFEIEANAGDRRFQLMRDGIEKAVLALVAFDFAHDKDGVDDESGDDRRKKDNPEDQRDDAARVVDDPADVEEDRDRGQNRAQRDEKRDCSCAAGDAHR